MDILKSTTSSIYRKVEAHVRAHVPRKGQVDQIVVALARAKMFNVVPDARVVRQLNLAEIRHVCCVISVS